MTTYPPVDDARRGLAGSEHLPDPTHLQPEDTDAVASYLQHVESVRAQQLAALPAKTLDPVTAAHRATVERILDEVSLALRRLREGSYGVCIGCGEPIVPGRLELRPWATACARCASHGQ